MADAALDRPVDAPFVRKSSGLVKTGTPFRMFAMNAAYNGLGTYMAFFYFYGAGAFPRGNLLLGVVYWSTALYFAFTTTVLGANAPQMVWFTVACFTAPILYIFGMRGYRKARGVNIDLAFTELPPD